MLYLEKKKYNICREQEEVGMEKCSNCGAPMENGICPYCGTKTEEVVIRFSSEEKYKRNVEECFIQNRNNEIKVSPKSKTVMLVFVIVFGALGFHNFYAGKIGKGILYVLTLGLFYIG